MFGARDATDIPFPVRPARRRRRRHGLLPVTTMDLPTLLSATSLTHLTESLKDCSLDELKSLPRAALLNKLKEVGVSKLTDRQALAKACSQLAKGQPLGTPAAKKTQPLRDLDLGKDVGKDFRSMTTLRSNGLSSELASLPALGPSQPLPCESSDATIRPAAKVRLLTFYGSADTAAAFKDWATGAPPWLEVRAIELPGHGTRKAEGVWPLGRRKSPPDADLATLAAAVADERARCVVALADQLAPLLTASSGGPPLVALYGFSAGAMLAYLLVLELQRRAESHPSSNAALPFRLFVCGRGAPHCVHTTPDFWTTVRSGSDRELMTTLNRMIGVPLPAAVAADAHAELEVVDEEADAAAAAELVATAELWRASISYSMVHVGDEPLVADPLTTPPFPTPEDALDALVYATNAPTINACPIVAIGSTSDKVWRWPTLSKWAEVAGIGFRAEAIESANVPHFRLMTHEEVVRSVTAELAGAAIAQARFG